MIQIQKDAILSAATSLGATIVRAPGATVIVLPDGDDDDDLLPLAQAAALVHTTPKALARAGRAGELNVMGKQRSRVVRRGDILAWKASQRVKLRAVDDHDIVRRMRRLERQSA